MSPLVNPPMDRIEVLRNELVDLVARSLTPVAMRYGYSETPLEDNIKWRPLVLILGNYSSGKSTLINELLGDTVQATGQAPTDDSFTVITYDERAPEGGDVRVTEERDGSVLLNDPQYPFARLRRHGQRFQAHFRLKKVKSPFLRHLTLIDTPGMLDSMAERDRGYDYQQVIGDFAEIADLILVMFDPHKAGTVREAYASLRETLPARTFEDRVLFVLNRVDECESLADLLRVYGTLCWNLSQMLGRKDIPPIRMTYAPGRGAVPPYLQHLPNERAALIKQISQAPQYRLDHLATFAETHGQRLSHFLEGLLGYKRQRLNYSIKMALVGFLLALVAGLLIAFFLLSQGVGDHNPALIVGIGALAGIFALWMILVVPGLGVAHHRRILNKDLDQLTSLATQSRRDSWAQVKELVRSHLTRTGGRFSAAEVRRELAGVKRVQEKGARDVREALGELGATTPR